MQEELEVLKGYVETLGLHEKDCITLTDQISLRDALREGDETGLADYIERLNSPNELEDLIVNTLYDGTKPAPYEPEEKQTYEPHDWD